MNINKLLMGLMPLTLQRKIINLKRNIIFKYFKHKYIVKILSTKPVSIDTNSNLEIHTIACNNDFLYHLWSLKTFFYYSELRPKLVIYDDGTLTEYNRGIFLKDFPGCRIIQPSEYEQGMDKFFSSYQSSRKYAAIKSFFCRLKLLSVPCYAESDNIILLDSDILFFNKPIEVIEHLKNKRSFYLSDYQNEYSYPVDSLKEMFGVDVFPKINAGFTYLPKSAYLNNLNFINDYFEKISKVKSLNKINKHEQTVQALLLSKSKAVRLGPNYQISKQPQTDTTVCQHYCNDGSRPYIYTVGIKKLVTQGFIAEFNKA